MVAYYGINSKKVLLCHKKMKARGRKMYSIYRLFSAPNNSRALHFASLQWKKTGERKSFSLACFSCFDG